MKTVAGRTLKALIAAAPALLCAFGCAAGGPQADQPDAAAPPSYADTVAEWQTAQGPGMLSEEDVAVMDKAAEDLAAEMPSPGLKVGDEAPDFSLPNAQGRRVRLYHALARGPVVLVFYRGAWCPYCNMHLRVLQDALPAIAERGAILIAVTPQTPDKSRGQIEENGIGFELLSDLDSSVAEAYGLNFRVAEALSNLYMDRFGLDLADYNGAGRYALPVPATFVIDQGAIIRAAFADTDYKERMEPADILRALDRLNKAPR
jgi:peroxiredoxin